jgi:hypothetical protein
MTTRAKRLMLTMGVLALLAVVAGAVLAPELVAAPKPKTDFIITTDLAGGLFRTTGTWKARGAINSSGGYAECSGTELVLVPPYAPWGTTWMVIQLDESAGTFEVVEAYEDYGFMLGASGTYSEHWVRHYNDMNMVWEYKGGHKLTGSLP